MSSPRTHIILVPGFVGFDGLGQMAYYAGTTDLFKSWKQNAQNDARAQSAVLHYFDNFPTASVATRAFRLREFLTKMIARGEIADQDRISLVGHSTGGLDIRRLLHDLSEQPEGETLVDGPKPVSTSAPAVSPPTGKTAGGTTPGERAVGIKHDAILGRGREMKLAFLSVPQYGTNIASFIDESHYRQVIRLALTWARIGLEANRGSLPDLMAPLLQGNPLGSDIPLAVLDALRESDLRASTLREAAYEREAASSLLLWLGHMESDFSAIDDLRAGVPPGSSSPAHFNREKRQQELAQLSTHAIRTRSYVTRAPAPKQILPPAKFTGTLSGELAKAGLASSLKVAAASLVRAPGVVMSGASVIGGVVESGPNLLNNLVAALPAVPGALRNLPGNVVAAFKTAFGPQNGDVLYALAYSMCAYQPFPGRDSLRLPLFEDPARTAEVKVEDNDGIVNTVSMTFTDGPSGADGNHQAVLVDACDHADIIGHYTLQTTEAANDHGRQHSRYDFFKSDSAFNATRFQRIWEDVFNFCA
jgi:hypothetical protein